MAKSADDVLAELEKVGAVGAPPKTPSVPALAVTEVEMDQGPPSADLIDLRGEHAVGAVDDALRALDDTVRGLEGVREALVRLRRVWEDFDGVVAGAEVLPEGPEAAEAPSVPPEPEQASETLVEPPPHYSGLSKAAFEDPEAYKRAIEAARTKILGEGRTPEQWDDERGEDEDNVPYVGQVRALPPDREPEEVTIGTVGKIKPSFPAEESSDGT